MPFLHTQAKPSLQLGVGVRMRQGLVVLQAGVGELRELVEGELERNPALELVGELPSAVAYGGGGGDFVEGVVDAGGEGERRIAELNLVGGEREAAVVLVGDVDERGLLTHSLEATAEATGVSLADLRGAQGAFRHLSPTGWGARCLAEALVWQLEAGERPDALALELLRRAPDLLLGGKVAQAGAVVGASVGAVREALGVIADLRFHFGVGVEPAVWVPPDLVFKREGGGWGVRLAESYLRCLRVSPVYAGALHHEGLGREESLALRRQVKRSGVFLESLRRREQTLRGVGEWVVRRQGAFLEEGVHRLLACTLKEAAGELGVHPSTMGRAVKAKVVQTSHGMFPLRHCFMGGLGRGGGALSLSRIALQNHIARAVAEENPLEPLSDVALARRLREEGVGVGVRSVTNYRRAAHILPASQRKHLPRKLSIQES